MSNPSLWDNRARLAVLLILLLISSLGCSLGAMLVGEPTPTWTPAPPTPLPTWTPSPVGAFSPAQAATLTVIAALDFPTLTPTWTPIATDTPVPPLATPTPFPDTPTPEAPTITPTPTPFARVEGQVANVRTGPSVAYSIIGQARFGDLLTITGRNDAGTWWQVCCVNGQQGWIAAFLVSPQAPVDQVAIAGSAPPPAPTETPLPTETPRPYRPFDIGDGPQYFSSNNAWLTIWIKAFTGQPPIFLPSAGYKLRVLRNGVDVSKPDLTRNVFEWSQPSVEGEPEAYGNRRQYNLKYEYHPEAGDAQWTFYLMSADGVQLSPEVAFETKVNSLLREVYVGFYDMRPY